MIALDRARARAGTFVVVAVLVAILVATFTSALVRAESARTLGAREALATAGAQDATLVVVTRRAADTAAQDAALASALARTLPGVEVTTLRSERTEPLRVTGGSARVVVDLGRPPAATVVAGGWPVAADEGALQVDAARALGVDVGDDLALTGTDGTPVSVRVVGTWTPDDVADVAWSGDDLAAHGTDGTAFGPLVVPAPAGDEAFGGTPFVRWVVAPVTGSVVVDDLPVLAAGAADLRDVLRDDDAFAVRGVTVTGGLGTTADAAGSAVAAASAVSRVPLGLLGVVGVVALAQLARLLVGTRRGETVLLLARGASGRRLVALGVAEAVPVAAAGALLGAVVGVLGSDGPPRGTVAPVLVAAVVAAATALVATVLLAVAVLLDVRAVLAGDARARAPRVLAGTSVVLVALAAALCTAQLLRLDAPVGTAADGTTRTDPLAVLAPTTLLLLAALVALALLGPAARGVAALAARGPGLTVVLAARQLARRVAVVAVPVLLVALAAGTSALAGGIAATSVDARAATQQALTGADARVSVGAASGTSGLVGASRTAEGGPAGVDGVTDAESVLRARGSAGEVEVTVLGRGAGTTAGVPVPAGEAVELGGTPGVEGAAVVWLADPDGALARVPVGDGTARGTVELPAPDVPWRLVAVDLPLGSTAAPSLTVGGDRLDLTGWAAVPDLAAAGSLAPDLVRWMPDGAAAVAPLPAVASGELASALALAPGDTVTLRVAGSDVPVVVGSVVRAVQGTSALAAVQVDLAAFEELQLRTRVAPLLADEAWLTLDEGLTGTTGTTGSADTTNSTAPTAPAGSSAPTGESATDPAAVASAAADALVRTGTAGPASGPLDVTLAATGTDQAGPVRAVFATVMLGVVLVALLGVLASALAQLRERRGEVAVLRALGVGARAQGAARAGELVAATGGALVAGALAGLGVVHLVVPALVRALTPGAAGRVEVVPSVDLTVVGLGLGAVACGVLVVALIVVQRVRRQAATATTREDVR
ncbi:FtsX-like permease family protein [Sediminihabitans luteus]|uniref:FtsX-like permease family protein n=1 Tax=Sediminihabitans luteus TaxID=1138585 RepID=A0A2M9CZ61_9CELL|nr:FtsX-like permease family protein [Sediminihabitans luteus]PJJ77018.1 FtsX-like permease family protein [Sediminihabitans luteus]GII99660.1 hypothetical protein Slu03_20380 [Sediminihabitans luteus]